MEIKKKKKLLIIGIMTLISVLLGSSYAFFMYSKTLKALTLTSNEIRAEFLSGSNAIKIDYAYPISDNYAKKNLDKLGYIDFTVKGKVSNKEEKVVYEIYLTEDSNNTLDSNYIKVYLTDNNNVEIVEPSIYGKLPVTTLKSESDGKVILTENGIGTFENKYRLYVWLDENYTQNEVSQEFSFKVNLYAYNGKTNTLKDKIMELANNKTCRYADDDVSSYVTDRKCEDWTDPAEPHYYTYFTGDNDCLDFNYVWYSGKMWRITEILDDGKIKMISENVLSAINFGTTGDWKTSFMRQWLNEDFLDTLYHYQWILETNASWDISPNYAWCWETPPETVTATVGLLNPYEYSKSASSGKYLNLGHSWWLSSYMGADPPYTSVSGVGSNGEITGWVVPNNAFGVRPVVVLKADVKFSGEGTQTNPFVLLDDKKDANPGDKINTRVSGEFVKIKDMVYRIVNTHEQNGKLVTKLSSAYYIRDENGNVLKKKFGEMQEMPTYEKIVNTNNDNYWGAYLNNTWLKNQDIEKYLVKDTYYLGTTLDSGASGTNFGSYKNTICKEEDTTETTKDCEKTDKTWTGYVGLPIVGELFAYPLGGTETEDYKTATMTPYGTDEFPMIGAFETETQGIFQEEYDNYFAVKPSITLKENVVITSGDGKTPATAFEIAFPS